MRWPLVTASVLVACVVTVLGVYVAIAEAGAGHGTYFTARLFFPYTMLSVHLFEVITLPFIIMAIAQFGPPHD